ncbi:DUF3120 domain-containing protein [Phormidium sp. CLA17]|uniref:DUF3120 domain-containing protein n=1 Tax=Leptolyngbya sp. Cla-17 TaxID=2803751 RepID=UPI0014912F78|nr:DUF3120 domain-containing protein [Leptolyngbya sp. Cla-17]MBM0740201.1 DUF3120 domain-containing protein [Leptolyngbya sp. Cla-17]
MISYPPPSTSSYAPESTFLPKVDSAVESISFAEAVETKVITITGQHWRLFAVAVLLVSVPVFVQAPLVRSLPLISLLATVGLWAVSNRLSAQPKNQVWGDLLLGFTWTWLAGSLYWGWFRWEPYFHLPIESIGLPFAVWGISRNQGKVGHFFYLGSLLGTAITDIYFYLVDLIPHWRKLMQVSEELARPIFHSAIAQVQTPWGTGWALVLAISLLSFSLFPLRSLKLHWWVFGGAVLSTILVDGLFLVAACIA